MQIHLCRQCGHGVVASTSCPHCQASLSPYRFYRLVVSSLTITALSLLVGQQMLPGTSVLEAGVVFDMRRPVEPVLVQQPEAGTAAGFAAGPLANLSLELPGARQTP